MHKQQEKDLGPTAVSGLHNSASRLIVQAYLGKSDKDAKQGIFSMFLIVTTFT
jgi:hypothetical protein